MANRYEVKLEFTANIQNTHEILQTISQTIRAQLHPHVSDFKSVVTFLGEDTKNEAE